MIFRKNTLIDKFNKVIAFCTLIYLEIVTIALLLLGVWNIYKDTRNLFGDYVNVYSQNDIIEANKNNYSAVVLNGMLVKTGILGLDENGDIDKVYYLIELEDANILFGVDERFISNYIMNEKNIVHALIRDIRFDDKTLINRLESDMKLSKKIIKEFRVIEYSINGMREFLLIVAVIILIISLEAIIRGRKEFRRITGGKW